MDAPVLVQLSKAPMRSSELPEVAKKRGIKTLHIQNDWQDLTAVIIGNGPSTIGLDFSRFDRPDFRTIVANTGMFTFPDADVLMCSDRHWLLANSADMSGFKGSQIVVTRPEAVVKIDPRMRFVRREFIEKVHGDIFRDPQCLVEGHTSTSTGISLAVLRGAARCILVGVDLSPGAHGRRRAYGQDVDTPQAALRRYSKQVVHLTRQSEYVLRRGVIVINCSPRSDLECYPYARLEDVC